MKDKPLAVGVDASTQGVKALALGPDGVEAVAAVNFGKDLPQFGAPDGFAPDPRAWAAAKQSAIAAFARTI